MTSVISGEPAGPGTVRSLTVRHKAIEIGKNRNKFFVEWNGRTDTI